MDQLPSPLPYRLCPFLLLFLGLYAPFDLLSLVSLPFKHILHYTSDSPPSHNFSFLISQPLPCLTGGKGDEDKVSEGRSFLLSWIYEPLDTEKRKKKSGPKSVGKETVKEGWGKCDRRGDGRNRSNYN